MSGEKELSNVNFFICSTYEDLTPYRSSVIAKIRSKAGIINAQEFFGSRDQKPIETCLEEVRKSDVFLMFLAFRYGTVIQETGKSFVECEYDKAKDLGLFKLAYLMDANHPFPNKYTSTGADAEKLAQFKERLKAEHTIDTFTTPDDLAEKVLNDLQRELPKRGFVIGTQTLPQRNNEPESLLRKFVLLPKIYYGNEFSAEVVPQRHSRATESECEAFSLRYGATLKTEFKAVDEKLHEFLSENKLNHMWASDEMAEKLLSADGKVMVTLKTIQGQYVQKTPIYSDPKVDAQYSPFAINVSPYYPFYHPRQVVGYETTSYLECGLKLSSID